MRSCGNITFYTNPALSADELVDLYRRAGESLRAREQDKLNQLIRNSNLLVAAYVGNRLVGVVRALSDFCSCCYVAEVVVDAGWQASGVQEALLRQVRLEVDTDVELVVPFLATPAQAHSMVLQ